MFSKNNPDFKGYAVVDLETTGLGLNEKIVEIGMVILNPDGEVTETIDTLIQPLTPMKASRIHGITDEMVAYAPTMEMIVPHLLAAIDGCVLVAHNAPFEARFLHKELEPYGVPIYNANFVDTLTVSRKFLKKMVNHKLFTVAKHYNIEIENPHQAFADAYATALVFQKMLLTLPEEAFNQAAPVFVDGYENFIADKSSWVQR